MSEHKSPPPPPPSPPDIDPAIIWTHDYYPVFPSNLDVVTSSSSSQKSENTNPQPSNLRSKVVTPTDSNIIAERGWKPFDGPSFYNVLFPKRSAYKEVPSDSRSKVDPTIGSSTASETVWKPFDGPSYLEVLSSSLRKSSENTEPYPSCSRSKVEIPSGSKTAVEYIWKPFEGPSYTEVLRHGSENSEPYPSYSRSKVEVTSGSKTTVEYIWKPFEGPSYTEVLRHGSENTDPYPSYSRSKVEVTSGSKTTVEYIWKPFEDPSYTEVLRHGSESLEPIPSSSKSEVEVEYPRNTKNPRETSWKTYQKPEFEAFPSFSSKSSKNYEPHPSSSRSRFQNPRCYNRTFDKRGWKTFESSTYFDQQSSQRSENAPPHPPSSRSRFGYPRGIRFGGKTGWKTFESSTYFDKLSSSSQKFKNYEPQSSKTRFQNPKEYNSSPASFSSPNKPQQFNNVGYAKYGEMKGQIFAARRIKQLTEGTIPKQSFTDEEILAEMTEQYGLMDTTSEIFQQMFQIYKASFNEQLEECKAAEQVFLATPVDPQIDYQFVTTTLTQEGMSLYDTLDPATVQDFQDLQGALALIRLGNKAGGKEITPNFHPKSA